MSHFNPSHFNPSHFKTGGGVYKPVERATTVGDLQPKRVPTPFMHLLRDYIQRKAES